MPLPYLISTYIIKSKNEESDISAIIKSKESVKCLSTYTDWFYKDDKKKMFRAFWGLWLLYEAWYIFEVSYFPERELVHSQPNTAKKMKF